MNRDAGRPLDRAIALAGLVVLSPVLAGIAMAVRVLNGRPVLFRQVRVGYRGEPFVILKFRTMTDDSSLESMSLTVGGDSRVTPIGKALRAAKLDELPQLLNVVRGEMSLVGPRPEVPEYVAFYTLDQRRVLDVLPGITDPASIAYRHESALLADSDDPVNHYVRVVLPDKIDRNLRYVSRATWRSDIVVILMTLIPGIPSRWVSEATRTPPCAENPMFIDRQ
jgi:lipopolysaccharide/colanic/teichoic acid biosynthesis glycosyltransferase